MNAIKFNFRVPKLYRREFHLILPKARHRLTITKDGVLLDSTGFEDHSQQGRILDWIQESIMDVRRELGQP